MQNIKLTIAYEGTAFHGWQIQPGLATIQGTLADAARKITQDKIFVHGASRTDAGVHALGQVAHFKTHSNLSVDEFRRALNAVMPPQIRIMAAEEVGADFHSRWQSLSKTYRYRIFRGRVLPPFEYRRVLHYPWPLDEAAMAEGARFFEGTHDFTSFAASSGSEDDDKDREMNREIYRSEIIHHPYAAFVTNSADSVKDERPFEVNVNEAPREIHYEVHGKSFLRYMVRKIVGTLLEVGKGRLKPADIASIFELKDRSRSGPTVGPEGLYLVSLEYPDPTASLAHGRPHIRTEIG